MASLWNGSAGVVWMVLLTLSRIDMLSAVPRTIKEDKEEMSKMMQQKLLDVAMGREDVGPANQYTEEDVEDLLKDLDADPVPKELLESVKAADIWVNDLTCSGCLWTARMVRSALVDSMPRKVRKPEKRRDRALKAMKAKGKDAICSKRRLPPILVLADRNQVATCKMKPVQDRPCRIVDLHDARRKATGAGQGFAPSGFETMIKTKDMARRFVTRICDIAQDELANAIADKAKAFKGRIFNAVSDKWFCTQAMTACTEYDLRMGQRTYDDDDGEDDEAEDDGKDDEVESKKAVDKKPKDKHEEEKEDDDDQDRGEDEDKENEEDEEEEEDDDGDRDNNEEDDEDDEEKEGEEEDHDDENEDEGEDEEDGKEKNKDDDEDDHEDGEEGEDEDDDEKREEDEDEDGEGRSDKEKDEDEEDKDDNDDDDAERKEDDSDEDREDDDDEERRNEEDEEDEEREREKDEKDDEDEEDGREEEDGNDKDDDDDDDERDDEDDHGEEDDNDKDDHDDDERDRRDKDNDDDDQRGKEQKLLEKNGKKDEL